MSPDINVLEQIGAWSLASWGAWRGLLSALGPCDLVAPDTKSELKEDHLKRSIAVGKSCQLRHLCAVPQSLPGSSDLLEGNLCRGVRSSSMVKQVSRKVCRQAGGGQTGFLVFGFYALRKHWRRLILWIQLLWRKIFRIGKGLVSSTLSGTGVIDSGTQLQKYTPPLLPPASPPKSPVPLFNKLPKAGPLQRLAFLPSRATLLTHPTQSGLSRRPPAAGGVALAPHSRPTLAGQGRDRIREPNGRRHPLTTLPLEPLCLPLLCTKADTQSGGNVTVMPTSPIVLVSNTGVGNRDGYLRRN